ncbi:penicillin-binding transpeptidase domain-containing protein, partial [Gemelliphila asaccharolytica]
KKIIGNPISKETAEKTREELYGVVNGQWSSGGKKYRLENYSVAGKTGTAQIVDPRTGSYYSNPYKVLHSFIGYAPSDNPEIIVYSVIKNPSKNIVQNYSTAVKELFNPITLNTLNYLNVKDENNNTEKNNYIMADYEEKSKSEAVEMLSKETNNIEILGNGDNIIKQFPSKGNIVNKSDRVFLLTEDTKFNLPNFSGWSKIDVMKYSELTGIKTEIEGNGYVKTQSIAKGKIVEAGENLKVKLE